jgi:hypothetical protein
MAFSDRISIQPDHLEMATILSRIIALEIQPGLSLCFERVRPLTGLLGYRP